MKQWSVSSGYDVIMGYLFPATLAFARGALLILSFTLENMDPQVSSSVFTANVGHAEHKDVLMQTQSC